MPIPYLAKAIAIYRL